VKYKVTQADVNAGSITNTATASGADGGTSVTSDPSTAVVNVTQSPNLLLEKTADVTSAAAAGTAVNYTFTVTNTGNVTLTDVKVTEGDFTGSDSLSAVSCPTTSLDPGTDMACTATYSVSLKDMNNGGDLVNKAEASGVAPNDGPTVTSDSSATVTVNQLPSLSLTKTADVSSVSAAGTTVTYTFTVTDTGNVTVTGVKIAELAGFTGSGTVSDTDCSQITNDSLDPGASGTCTATYVVTQPDMDAGADIVNTATASGTAGTAPNDQTVTSDPSSATVSVAQTPSVSLVKSASVASAAGVAKSAVTARGDVVTYSFEVTNTGNVTLTGLVVNDSTFTGSGALGAVTCPDTPLAVGASVACSSVKYTVTSADLDGGTISNTATVSGTGPNGGSVVSGSDTAIVPVAPAYVSICRWNATDRVYDAGAETVRGDTVTADDIMPNGVNWTTVPAPLAGTGDVETGQQIYGAGCAVTAVLAAEPTPSPTPSPKTAVLADNNAKNPELAFTGADVSALAGLAALLLGGGFFLVVLARRRRRDEENEGVTR